MRPASADQTQYIFHVLFFAQRRAGDTSDAESASLRFGSDLFHGGHTRRRIGHDAAPVLPLPSALELRLDEDVRLFPLREQPGNGGQDKPRER